MEGLRDRDQLYNAVLKTIKEHGTGMQIGVVRAVLGEIDSAIASWSNRNDFAILCEKLTERKPRECT